MPSYSPIPQVKKLSPRDITVLRQLALDNFYIFTKGILGYEMLTEDMHGALCRHLQDDELRRFLAVMPRGFLKTTICSVAYPIWEVMRDPTKKILIAQHTLPVAKQRIREIKAHFEQNQVFRAVFWDRIPDFNQTIWSDEAIKVEGAGLRGEPSIMGIGTGGGVIGTHWDIIVGDDLVAPSKDEATQDEMYPSRDKIEKAIGWFSSSLDLFKHGHDNRYIVAGTRWAPEDVIQHVENARNTEQKLIFTKYQRSAIEDDKPSWPEHCDQERLDELKAMKGETMFNMLYLNKPFNPAIQVFRAEYVENYYPRAHEDPAQAIPEPDISALRIYTAADLAISQEKWAHYTVIITIGVDEKYNRYVLDIRRGKFQPSETIDQLFEVFEAYHPLKIGLETVAFQQCLAHWAKQQMGERDTYMPIEEITRDKRSKEMRVRGMEPDFRARKIFLRREMKQLRNELIDFPLGRTDDIIDALADVIRMSKPASGDRPTPQRLNREAMAKYRKHFFSGDYVLEELLPLAAKETPQLPFDSQLKGKRFHFLASKS